MKKKFTWKYLHTKISTRLCHPVDEKRSKKDKTAESRNNRTKLGSNENNPQKRNEQQDPE